MQKGMGKGTKERQGWMKGEDGRDVRQRPLCLAQYSRFVLTT